MSFVAAPFLLMGMYALVGHYVVDAWHRQRLVYGISNRRLLIATPSRLVAAPALGELRTHLVKRDSGYGDLHVVSPRLAVRVVPDAENVQRVLLEAQTAAPDESVPASSVR